MKKSISRKVGNSHFESVFNPGGLSCQGLLWLANLYSKLYVALDGFWYMAVMGRMGNDKALDCDLLAWQYRVADEVKK